MVDQIWPGGGVAPAASNSPPPALAGALPATTADRARRRVRLFGVSFWAAIALRLVVDIAPVGGPAEWLAVAAVAAYAILLATEPALTRRAGNYPWLYLALQTALVLSLFGLVPNRGLDYFAALFIPLSAQAMLLLPRPWRERWVGLFTVAMVGGLAYALGWPTSLPFVLLYAGSFAFVASYAALTEQAETARERSRSLLVDLQAAYRRLEAAAAQAEELAAVQERTRLARDLHDSVAQTLFGLTLAAEAASRALANGQPKAAAAQVGDVRETAHQALAELRLLVFELRPPTLPRQGLAASLRSRLEAVEGRAGLATSLTVDGDGRLPAAVEAELDRIAREALTNVLKHARAGRVAVHLGRDGATATLAVTDDGVGFDPDAPAAGGGLGLRGMAERAAAIGGTLAVASRPGEGTRVRVEVPG